MKYQREETSYPKSKCDQWWSTRDESKVILTNLLSTSRTAVLRFTDMFTLVYLSPTFHLSLWNMDVYNRSFSWCDCVPSRIEDKKNAAVTMQKQRDFIATILLLTANFHKECATSTTAEIYSPVTHTHKCCWSHWIVCNTIFLIVEPSVCPSVCLSITCVIVTKWMKDLPIFLYHMKGNFVYFFVHTDPTQLQKRNFQLIFARITSALTSSEKSSIMTNRKSLRA